VIWLITLLIFNSLILIANLLLLLYLASINYLKLIKLVILIIIAFILISALKCFKESVFTLNNFVKLHCFLLLLLFIIILISYFRFTYTNLLFFINNSKISLKFENLSITANLLFLSFKLNTN